MQVTYSKTFLKDLSRVSPASRKIQIEKFVFEFLPQISSFEDAGNIEKMTGHNNYYKVRFGDFRVGLVKNKTSIEILRVLNRKDIYKYFP